MHRHLQGKLTYANVVATLALFIALGGSSYAAIKVTGKNVRNGSLTGKDIKRNSLGGKRIKESSLKAVPRARTLNGNTGQRFLIKCPRGTFPTGGTCIETKPRAASIYSAAGFICAAAGGDKTPGRRLPTQGELTQAFTQEGVDLAPGGELTGNVTARADGSASVVIVTTESGRVGAVPDQGGFTRPFRCAADPLN